MDIKPGKVGDESIPSLLPPFRAGQVHAQVVLIPPLADSSEVQERIMEQTLTDVQRYIHLADKLLAGEKNKDKAKSEAATNAA